MQMPIVACIHDHAFNVAHIFVAHSLISLDKKSRNTKLKATYTCRTVSICRNQYHWKQSA